jgi:hypothetical protein
LGSVLEDDEFSDAVERQESINKIVNTPASLAVMRQQLNALSSLPTLKTPKTEPKPSRGEMHPKSVHPTTKSPDSGFKLGFIDLPENRPSIATVQNTPSKARLSVVEPPTASSFNFNVGSESALSSAAQQLMGDVREEAARIKAEMLKEKNKQEESDADAERMFDGISANGRKIAQPKPKAGRFSDVHMAQFKKMDSIANHPSSFRARPGFAQPTTQSLKRSGSKAGLDELERPQTAGKGTPSRIAPPFGGRPTNTSTLKNLPSADSHRLENSSPAKRLRRSENEDVSTAKGPEQQSTRPSAIPKSVSNSLLSPTKASLARSGQANISSPTKTSMFPRTNSAKSIRTSAHASRPSSASVTKFTSKLIEAQQEHRNKPLPAPPANVSPPVLQIPKSNKTKVIPVAAPTPKQNIVNSKLPLFSGLKSILRSTRKPSVTKALQRTVTPKKQNKATYAPPESMKKVDFTPSVKSRYAVKLAASSPAPARLPSSEERLSPELQYDPAAYVLEEDGDELWEDASSPIQYPSLPSVPNSASSAASGFSQKANMQNRRESKEFKSIFTTLHHPSRPRPSTLTSVNTTINTTSPLVHANRVMKSPSNSNSKPSPSTIRRVRKSGVTDLVEPFADTAVQTVSHGLPAKKRRRDSITAEDRFGTDADSKENRHISHMPIVPGGWQDSILEDKENDAEDEGIKRAGKRARVGPGRLTVSSGYDADAEKEDVRGLAGMNDAEKKNTSMAAGGQKRSAARTQAAKNARDRKSGVLSLSRLNMLSRPKQRG